VFNYNSRIYTNDTLKSNPILADKGHLGHSTPWFSQNTGLVLKQITTVIFMY